jgi:hypothetical protein
MTLRERLNPVAEVDLDADLVAPAATRRGWACAYPPHVRNDHVGCRLAGTSRHWNS